MNPNVCCYLHIMNNHCPKYEPPQTRNGGVTICTGSFLSILIVTLNLRSNFGHFLCTDAPHHFELEVDI